MAAEQGLKMIARNRRARHDYHIEEVVEAGLVLTGTEVKSLRAGRASLTDGFGQIADDEVWLHNVHIPEYTQGTWTNHEPRRTRKLLMHRREIDKLASETTESNTQLSQEQEDVAGRRRCSPADAGRRRARAARMAAPTRVRRRSASRGRAAGSL